MDSHRIPRAARFMVAAVFLASICFALAAVVEWLSR